MAKRRNAPSPGPAVDAFGNAVRDPTLNVLSLVDASAKRLDDLRKMDAEYAASSKSIEHEHLRELMSLRAGYEDKLRRAETERIDAIRAVDVGAVNRAAEVSAAQATTLAAQVATSAEALRAQVAAAAAAATTSLAAALEPIIKDIADLRRVQYEQVGQRAQVSETREVRGESRLNYGAVLGGVSIVLVLIFGVLGLVLAR